MPLTSLEKSIVYTLAYTIQFQFPLTKNEISERLIFRLSPSIVLLEEKVTSVKFDQALQHLKKQGWVSSENGYYFLPGFKSTVTTRQQRAHYSQSKTAEIQQFLKSIQACPWVEAVFVTGSAAMQNMQPAADLDFMIVTQPGRLWLTRLWVIAQAWRRGKRRSWQGEEQRSWCFNLWLESDQMTLFQDMTSLYIAYELIQARPVFDRHHLAIQLLAQNRWAAQFLPHAINWPTLSSIEVSVSSSFSPFSLLNALAYVAQRWYMAPHMTRERVSWGYAFFHPRDSEAWILAQWTHILRRVADVRT